MADTHDHQICIDRAIDSARRICLEKNLRLTDLRLNVLRVVWASHKPVGAYDIIDRLSEVQSSQATGADASTDKPKRVAPPTVYRALEFLQQNGLVHRLATINAFIGCGHPMEDHHSHFFICRECHHTVESSKNKIQKALLKDAREHNFLPEEGTIEVLGLCSECLHDQTRKAS